LNHFQTADGDSGDRSHWITYPREEHSPPFFLFPAWRYLCAEQNSPKIYSPNPLLFFPNLIPFSSIVGGIKSLFTCTLRLLCFSYNPYGDTLRSLPKPLEKAPTSCYLSQSIQTPSCKPQQGPLRQPLNPTESILPPPCNSSALLVAHTPLSRLVRNIPVTRLGTLLRPNSHTFLNFSVMPKRA